MRDRERIRSGRRFGRMLLAAGAAWMLASTVSADTIELNDGRKLVGKVVSQDGQYVKFRVVYASGGSAEMTLARRDVKSVTIRDDDLPRPKPPTSVTPTPPTPPTPTTPTPTPTTPTPTPPPRVPPAMPPPAGPGGPVLSQAQVEALIARDGPTPPDWWDQVKLNYPATLDMGWPDRPPPPWNPNKNIGQYFYGTINENPGRWKEGCKFAHHLLTVYKDNKHNLFKTMVQLGQIYGTLLQDYPRSAYWYRRAGATETLGFYQSLRLAECYWRIGSKSMALAELGRQQSYSAGTIKLLGEMGDLSRALTMAADLARTYPHDGYLAAGDACRYHGQYKQALEFYQKVIATPVNKQRPGPGQMMIKRATSSAEAILLFEMLDISRIPDGSYSATAVGYAAPITVQVAVRSGRVVSVKPTDHHEKLYFTAFEDVERQIIAKQSVKGIDTTSSATRTAEGVINAAAKALAGAMK